MKLSAPIPVTTKPTAVLTLQQLSCLYIIGILHEYAPDQLSFLPANIRRVLMINIPVSDVLKMEHTSFTQGVDMHAVWTAITNKRLPNEYAGFVNSPMFKGSGSMKELYMEVLATVIFNNMCNKQSPSGYRSHRELALDLMFSIRNCLEISNWNKFLARNPSWLQYFQTFPCEFRQDRIVPVGRYQRHYVRSVSDMCLVTYYLSECYYFPSRVSVIATPFIKSSFWTDKFYPMVMERMRLFISRAESLWFSAIGDGDRISIGDSITNNFPCALRFVASEILANPMSSFKRICLQALDVRTLVSLVSAVTPLLALMKSPFTEYCTSTNHCPYKYLKEFSVAQPECGPLKEVTAHSLLFECLASVILHQEYLEELALGGINLLVDCQSYCRLVTALYHFAAKPSLTVLYLSDLPILRPLLQEVVERYLLGRTNRNQILHLHNVTIDPKTVPPNNVKTVVNMVVMKEECLNLKQLKLSQLYLPNRIMFWLFHQVHVFHLHTLELHGITIDPPFSLVNVVARHPGLHVQKLCLSNLDIPCGNSTAEDFKFLLTKKYLRILSITRCQIGEKGLLQDLTTALNRIQNYSRAPIAVSFVDVLNLSENGLGAASDALIHNFFAALFRLSLQPNLGLDIRSNKMTSHHFTVMYVAWVKYAAGRKLKQLQCQWNHVPLDRDFLAQMAQWVFI